MLITKTDYISGGQMRLGDGYGVSITGKKLIDAPVSYQDYGIGGEFRAVRTPHHEFGHYAMGSVNFSHDWGETIHHGDGNHYMTPMYVQAGANQCGDDADRQGDKGWEQVWSNCCQGEW